MPGRDGWVVANGLRFHYLEWGAADRPPMVLLHGLRGHAHSWDDVSAALAGEYRVIALDQRGRGESDWAPDGRYTTEAYVADLSGVADTLALTPFVLVGHSMGGRNAIMFAAERPERVAALVIVDVGPEIAPAGMTRIRDEIVAAPEEFESFDAALAHARAANPRVAEPVLARRLRHQTKVLPTGKTVWRYDPVIRDQWRAGTRPPAPDFWALCGKIRCPALIVRATETDVLSGPAAERMRTVIPRARLVEVPRAGHMVFEENPVDFIAALREWVAGGVGVETRR